MKTDLPLVQLVVVKNPRTSCYEVITFTKGQVNNRYVDLDSSQVMMKLEDLVPMLVPVT
jgi:hypothetical protein